MASSLSRRLPVVVACCCAFVASALAAPTVQSPTAAAAVLELPQVRKAGRVARHNGTRGRTRRLVRSETGSVDGGTGAGGGVPDGGTGGGNVSVGVTGDARFGVDGRGCSHRRGRRCGHGANPVASGGAVVGAQMLAMRGAQVPAPLGQEQLESPEPEAGDESTKAKKDPTDNDTVVDTPAKKEYLKRLDEQGKQVQNSGGNPMSATPCPSLRVKLGMSNLSGIYNASGRFKHGRDVYVGPHQALIMYAHPKRVPTRTTMKPTKKPKFNGTPTNESIESIQTPDEGINENSWVIKISGRILYALAADVSAKNLGHSVDAGPSKWQTMNGGVGPVVVNCTVKPGVTGLYDQLTTKCLNGTLLNKTVLKAADVDIPSTGVSVQDCKDFCERVPSCAGVDSNGKTCKLQSKCQGKFMLKQGKKGIGYRRQVRNQGIKENKTLQDLPDNTKGSPDKVPEINCSTIDCEWTKTVPCNVNANPDSPRYQCCCEPKEMYKFINYRLTAETAANTDKGSFWCIEELDFFNSRAEEVKTDPKVCGEPPCCVARSKGFDTACSFAFNQEPLKVEGRSAYCSKPNVKSNDGLLYKFAQSTEVWAYQVRSRKGFDQKTLPSSWVLEGSDDLKNWTKLSNVSKVDWNSMADASIAGIHYETIAQPDDPAMCFRLVARKVALVFTSKTCIGSGREVVRYVVKKMQDSGEYTKGDETLAKLYRDFFDTLGPLLAAKAVDFSAAARMFTSDSTTATVQCKDCVVSMKASLMESTGVRLCEGFLKTVAIAFESVAEQKVNCPKQTALLQDKAAEVQKKAEEDREQAAKDARAAAAAVSSEAATAGCKQITNNVIPPEELDLKPVCLGGAMEGLFGGLTRFMLHGEAARKSASWEELHTAQQAVLKILRKKVRKLWSRLEANITDRVGRAEWSKGVQDCQECIDGLIEFLQKGLLGGAMAPETEVAPLDKFCSEEVKSVAELLPKIFDVSEMCETSVNKLTDSFADQKEDLALMKAEMEQKLAIDKEQQAALERVEDRQKESTRALAQANNMAKRMLATALKSSNLEDDKVAMMQLKDKQDQIAVSLKKIRISSRLSKTAETEEGKEEAKGVFAKEQEHFQLLKKELDALVKQLRRKGAAGGEGADGEDGLRGPKGPRGQRGPQGEKGVDGEEAEMFTVPIDPDMIKYAIGAAVVFNLLLFFIGLREIGSREDVVSCCPCSGGRFKKKHVEKKAPKVVKKEVIEEAPEEPEEPEQNASDISLDFFEDEEDD